MTSKVLLAMASEGKGQAEDRCSLLVWSLEWMVASLTRTEKEGAKSIAVE